MLYKDSTSYSDLQLLPNWANTIIGNELRKLPGLAKLLKADFYDVR
jgi:hypothetical protein